MKLIPEHLECLKSQLKEMNRMDLLDSFVAHCEADVTRCIKQAYKHEHQFVAYKKPVVFLNRGVVTVDFRVKSFVRLDKELVCDYETPDVHFICLTDEIIK